MSTLEHLQETCDIKKLYARIVILIQMLRDATLDFKRENRPEEDMQIIMEELDPLLALKSLSVEALLKWRDLPGSDTWGMLFSLVESYLYELGVITESRTPRKPPYWLGNPLIDTTRNPASSVNTVFKATKERWDLIVRKTPPRNSYPHLEPLLQIAYTIVREVEWAIANGTPITTGLNTEYDDMVQLANAIVNAFETHTPNAVLHWYQGPNAPTWGHVYERTGDCLLAIGAITEKGTPIPAVRREGERNMLHYWMRDLAIHHDLIDALRRTHSLVVKDRELKIAKAPTDQRN